MIEYIKNWIIQNNIIIGIISGILTITIFIINIIKLFPYILKNKIKIKYFNLKNNIYFSFKNKKYVKIKENILKENYPKTLCLGYKIPEFNIIFENNSKRTYLQKEINIKINKIKPSYTPFLQIKYKGKHYLNSPNGEVKYENLKFELKNFSISKIKLEIQSIDFIIIENNIKKLDYLFTENKTFILDSNKSKDMIFNINKRNRDFQIYQITLNLNLNINGKSIKHKISYKSGENREGLFHSKKYGFYMIEIGLGGGPIKEYKIGKYFIPTSKGFSKINGKILKYNTNQTYQIQKQDFLNYSFKLIIDKPCELNIEIIFNFEKKKLRKKLYLDMSFPNNFDINKEIKGSIKPIN